MRPCWFLLAALFLHSAHCSHYEDTSDNEFAEFEDEEDPIEEVIQQTDFTQSSQDNEDDEDIIIDVDDDDVEEEDEDEDDSEFEHFSDMEEFEGFETKDERPVSEPKITITNVPVHYRTTWDSYWLEVVMLIGIIVYALNLFMGRAKNARFAHIWLHTHRQLLEENFSLVGDDGKLETCEEPKFIKETSSVYNFWCSGRTCCEGMLVELKLIKRQDIVSLIAGMMRPVLDQVHIKVIMNKEDMDSFVLCAASKKTALHFSKDMADLSVYCPERRPGDKFNIPASYNVMSELPEATSAILDSKLVAMLNKYQEFIDYIYFSDQYSGAKQQEDAGLLKLPDSQKVLLFGFNVPLKGVSTEEAFNRLKPLLVMVFYCMEKVKKYRLSKEVKAKAEKNRQRVEEAFLKSTHQARTEAAAARREEKRRLEKEKVMAEEDPEKQRRWEEKEQKRQAKKRAPKMKQLKVKAL